MSLAAIASRVLYKVESTYGTQPSPSTEITRKLVVSMPTPIDWQLKSRRWSRRPYRVQRRVYALHRHIAQRSLVEEN